MNETDTQPCGPCHGTGTKLDPTCAGNVYTGRDTLTRCSWCKGTGRQVVEDPKPWVRPEWYDDEIGPMPHWMGGEE